MDQIPRYIKNKNNPDKISYIHPLLKDILCVTYGCIVYQEQVMQIVRELGGYSLGRSDLVRRAMSKKKTDVMEQEKINFIYGITEENGNISVSGAIRRGVQEEIATHIFDEMMDFAKYAFNKSHAAAYAQIAYQTAWLKTFYPTEFMAALLTSVLDNTAKISQYIEECKRMNIKVLPPCINKSFSGFTVDENSIRFGLVAIKNVGRNFIKELVSERNKNGNFISFMDFCERMSDKDLNKRMIESLIKCGAFDCFNIYRSQLMQIYDKLLDTVIQKKKNNIKGQLSIFSNFNEKSDIEYPDIEEFPNENILMFEKEVMGLYLSGHPLEKYKDKLLNVCSTTVGEILLKDDVETGIGFKDSETVTIGGIITSIKRKSTKNNDMMAFVTVEDQTAPIEIIIFPKIYNEYSAQLIEDNIVVVQGRLSFKEDEQPKIICNSIIPIKLVKNQEKTLKVYLRMEKEDDIIINRLKPKLKFFHGNTPVCFYLENKKEVKITPRDMWISLNEAIINELKEVMGDDNVKIV
jgi:DNA polymerase-3 subunit alpha